MLLEIFPDAKFVHIVRNPYNVIPSSLHLWQTLYSKYGLQEPSFHGLENQVFTNYERFYQAVGKVKGLLKPAQFHELKYEDLLQSPALEMQRIYEQLNLGDFDQVSSAIQDYFVQNTQYKTNTYCSNSQLDSRIKQQLKQVFSTYGY
jgi:hypothetical protein